MAAPASRRTPSPHQDRQRPWQPGAHRRHRRRGEQCPEESHGAARHQGDGRQREGQDDRRARPRLQAQHRRHARCAFARYHPGAAGRRRPHQGLRSREHARSRQDADRGRLLRRTVPRDRRRRRHGADHGMGPVPRPRPRPRQETPQDARGGRPAQCLPALGHGSRGFTYFSVEEPRQGPALQALRPASSLRQPDDPRG